MSDPSKTVVSKLFCTQNRLSWRRITMCGVLQIGAYIALIRGNLDAQTWAWFAGGLAGMYVGGDSGEKIATLMTGGKMPPLPLPSPAPISSPRSSNNEESDDVDY